MASMQGFGPARKMWVTAVAATGAATAAPYVTPIIMDVAAKYPQLQFIEQYGNQASLTAAFVLGISWLIGYITPPNQHDGVNA